MVSEYRRGWEDALDVVLDLKDWEKVERISKKMKKHRIGLLKRGPLL